MREYKDIISLSKNSRGVWSLDTTIGCNSGTKEDIKGCYHDCYAARYSKKYGYDFSKTVLRKFKDKKHIESIIRKINKVPLSFIRIGTSGDPSEDWEHTTNVIDQIKDCNKEIVIITKHWGNLTESQLGIISKANVCINTSVSALDNHNILQNSLNQYKRIEPYCKSILRLVSCDFNLNNTEGLRLNEIQKSIFEDYKVLDTVLRVSKNNPYAVNGIINIKETKFMGKKCYVSKYNKKTYFGNCNNCLEMCGVNM